MTSDSQLIDDAGEVIPYAKKHLVADREIPESEQDPEITLENLWPEPDWKEWIAQGREIEAVAYMAMLYEGLPIAPKTEPIFGIDLDSWAEAYRDTIPILEALCRKTKTLVQAKKLCERLAERLLIDYSRISKLPVEQTYRFWSIGRGKNRTLRNPFSMTLRQRQLYKWLPKLGWPDNDIALQAAIVPVVMSNGKWVAGHIVGNRIEWNTNEYLDTEEQAIAAVLEKAAQSVEKRKPKPLTVRASVKDMERVGPSYRDGDVTAESLIKEFSMRGIQFGNALSQPERQEWVNQTWDAMADLAEALEMPRRWIGLGGIGLAFGARGQGSAAAHYEPDLKAINLTRAKGAGSLAHEWAHGIDHRLASSIFENSYFKPRYLSESRSPYFGEDGMAERSLRIFDCMKEICDLCYRQGYGQFSEYFQRSERYKQEKRISDRNWTSRSELFARAFESYVQDKLEQAGQYSPWLVHGTTEKEFDQEVNIPYPVGKERQDLEVLFDRIFSVLRNRSIDA